MMAFLLGVGISCGVLVTIYWLVEKFKTYCLNASIDKNLVCLWKAERIAERLARTTDAIASFQSAIEAARGVADRDAKNCLHAATSGLANAKSQFLIGEMSKVESGLNGCDRDLEQGYRLLNLAVILAKATKEPQDGAP